MDKDTVKKAMEIMEARGKKKPSIRGTSVPLPDASKKYDEMMEIANARSKAFRDAQRKEREMTPNSREQYLQNREAGDPLAIENSYEQWKKL